MSDTDRLNLHTRNATAYFETRAAADTAVNDLVAAGIPREQINIAGTGARSTATSDDRTFWEELKDFFLPAEDRYAYAEGLRRGGVVVSVRSDDGNYTRVLDILDRDGAVDLDKQEASWREGGWTGYPGEEAAAASTAAGIASQTDLSATSSSETVASPRRAAAAAGTEEVIPVYEEQLRVGKREVSHGRVRIRSYVVETPVNEQVRLRSESVQVERKPVDRPVAAADALFQDRVIEAEERAEEAVVAKDSRVKKSSPCAKRPMTVPRILAIPCAIPKSRSRMTAEDGTLPEPQLTSAAKSPSIWTSLHRTASRLEPSTTWTGQTKLSSPRARLPTASIITFR